MPFIKLFDDVGSLLLGPSLIQKDQDMAHLRSMLRSKTVEGILHVVS